MRLDTYLAMKGITAADCGRALGLGWPYSVLRYLPFLKSGKPNKHYRPPRRSIQMKIRRWSRGAVTLNDWPEPTEEAASYQREIRERWQLKQALKLASEKAVR